MREGGRGEGGRVGSGVHVYAERGTEVNLLREEDSTNDEDNSSTQTDLEALESSVIPSTSLAVHSLPPTLKV